MVNLLYQSESNSLPHNINGGAFQRYEVQEEALECRRPEPVKVVIICHGFIYRSSHSAQILGCVLVLGWKGSACVIFLASVCLFLCI